jgi:hypothetical protein
VRTCVVFPAGPRDPVACAGLTPDAVTSPPAGQVAMAIVRVADAVCTVSVQKVSAEETVAFAPGSDVAFAKGFVEAGDKQLTPPVRIDPASVRSAVVASAENVNLVRVTYDVTGFPPESPTALLAHQTAYAAPVEGGSYVVVWMTSARSAKTVDALAEESARTVHLAHPAPARSAPVSIGKIVVEAAPFLLFVFVGGWLARRHAQRRRARPGATG